jgi:predicted ATP-grasp superfamily ATP-dependent carboligase
MQQPEDLFTLARVLPDLGSPVLVQSVDGFIDAGGGRRLARQQLLGASAVDEVVVRFDVDQLIDYRSRRPVMTFDTDHWSAYDDPALVVRMLEDSAGTPYLLLDGPEPDYQWERFAAAVRIVVERLGVRLTVGLNAIPMAVPHTRPTGLTAHGTRADLLVDHTPWLRTIQVPGAIGNLLEFRLGQSGHDAVGFAVHVPHYVSQLEYPAAAVALLDATSRITGLALPTADLIEAAQQTAADIDAQVASSSEVAEIVRAVEEQYDAFLAEQRQPSTLGDPDQLPTADELGAELERYLANQTRRREDPPPAF